MYKIYPHDWTHRAAILGFYHLAAQHHDNRVKLTPTHLEITPSYFDDFPAIYTNYVFDKYDRANSSKEYIQYHLEKYLNTKDPEIKNKEKRFIIDALQSKMIKAKTIASNINESVLSEIEILAFHIEQIQEAADDEIEMKVQAFYQFDKNATYNPIMTANYWKSLFSNIMGKRDHVNLLTDKVRTRESNIQMMNEYLINPLRAEYQMNNFYYENQPTLQEAKAKIRDANELEKIAYRSLYYSIIHGFQYCEMNGYISINEQEQRIITSGNHLKYTGKNLMHQMFDSSVLNGMAMSISNNTNVTWNNCANNIPMSIVNSILYHCFIFGVAYKMNFQKDTSDVYFLDAPLPLQQLYQVNINYQNLFRGISFENPLGHYIVDQLELKKREAHFTLQGFNFIHLNCRGIISRTNHTIINYAKAKVLKDFYLELRGISHIIRDKWIELIIQNQSTKPYILNLLRQSLMESDPYILSSLSTMIRLHQRICCLQNEEDPMEVEKRLENMRKAGYFLRNAMQSEQGVSSDFNSQAHRLLNAIRLHDYETFSNYLLRLCLIYNQPAYVVTSFIQSKDEEKTSLAQMFMSSFLTPFKREGVLGGVEHA
jgi:hypothetical protein